MITIPLIYCSLWTLTVDLYMRLNIDLDDLRRRVPSFPARNVQQLSFTRRSWIGNMWEHSTLFDLFFSICYPHYVNANYGPFKRNIYLFKKNVRRMMEKKRPELKDVEIKNLRNGNWESLANFHRSFDEEANGYNSDEFKLTWCSWKNLINVLCSSFDLSFKYFAKT